MNEIIEQLIAEELKRANEINPLFSSQHEGSSIIREELEEVKEALIEASLSYDDTWKDVRHDIYMSGKYELLKLHVKHLIEEAIQVGAMCDKMIQSMNKL